MPEEIIIDTKELHGRLEGDIELLRELVQIFIKNTPQLIDRIKEAIKNNDMAKLTKSAHTIKGAVANFSAKKAFESALALEKTAKNNDMEKAGEAFKNLTDELEKMERVLQRIVGTGEW